MAQGTPYRPYDKIYAAEDQQRLYDMYAGRYPSGVGGPMGQEGPISPRVQTPTFPSAGINQTPPSGPKAPEDPYADIRKLFEQPLNEDATNRFNELMGQFPQRQDPGKFRSIAIALATMNPNRSPEELDYLRDPSYRGKLEDWKSQIDPASTAMIQERLGNVNLRTGAYQQSQAISGRIRAESTAKYQQARSAMEKYRLDNPNLKFVETDDGRILAFHPTNTSIPVRDMGVDTVSMDPRDKMNLEQEYAMERIDRNAEQDIRIKRTPGALIVTQTLGPPTIDSAQEEKVRYQNNRDVFLARNPTYTRYITVSSDGNITIAPADNVFTEQARNAAIEYIFGGTIQPPTGIGQRSTTPQTPIGPAPPPLPPYRGRGSISPVMPGSEQASPTLPPVGGADNDPLGIR